MLKRDLIQSKVPEKIHGSPSGVCCIFVPITDEIGAKTYQNKKDRDGCYNRQKVAAKYGLGPDVYGKFTLVANESVEYYEGVLEVGENIYGYLTEIVKIDPDSYDYDIAESLQEELLTKISFNFYDVGPNNVGYKNGKMVCVDFGLD
jgi:hypothetical protein